MAIRRNYKISVFMGYLFFKIFGSGDELGVV